MDTGDASPDVVELSQSILDLTMDDDPGSESDGVAHSIDEIPSEDQVSAAELMTPLKASILATKL